MFTFVSEDNWLYLMAEWRKSIEGEVGSPLIYVQFRREMKLVKVDISVLSQVLLRGHHSQHLGRLGNHNL